MKNGDLPAMPNQTDAQTLGCMGLMNTVADFYKHGTGLTKREMFAMTAMQGFVASSQNTDFTSEYERLIAVKSSVWIADDLLAELERTK